MKKINATNANVKDTLISEICKYRPKLPNEKSRLRAISVDLLKQKAIDAKRSYLSSDEGEVLMGRVNLIDG